MDLVVRPGPGVPHGLVVPETDLVERFSRASGPGGQSVNTSDSRVELLLDPAATAALDDAQRARVLRATSGRALVVVAAEHRSQHRNRVAARERLGDRLREALAPPPLPRVPTKPSRAARRRRVEAKKQRGRTKALRQRPTD
ncbi:aminoacyl-tRNA hydrolase [Nocardioides mangrovicus]|uniref:Aminoacyl-tRNA hydrolase n=1 Tax=Nocardioides mangrovicus TaxID=2478913 RepID=A0A3L8P4C6_9ACTN|nr:alternative ribosome rescue aminoacyl-tRNA hydrolase ArfB [Nocardioides mangrovicus]RLV49924.1 aminoacyl-tRNA hydrolase [Nocardioides mangrovicus]